MSLTIAQMDGNGKTSSTDSSPPIFFSRGQTRQNDDDDGSFPRTSTRVLVERQDSQDFAYQSELFTKYYRNTHTTPDDFMMAAFAHTDSQQKAYKRLAGQRVFVNRSVELGKIKFFGFDMDYTLAVYKSPEYEALGFKLILERLVKIGYPPELEQLPYDHTFPVRGLWFDKYYGNLLKVDAYGNILVAVHGQTFLKRSEVEELYPNKFIQLSEDRIYVLNTLFNLPETVVLSSLIAYMDNAPNSKREKTGIRMGDLYMSYKSIFKDVRNAVDYVHFEGDIKRITVERIDEFVHKDKRLPTMLANMRAAGRKTFLLTNSGYDYTHSVMTYLMDGEWTSYFDFIIVDAGKPQWFSEGTVFRQVDKETGALKIGMHTGPLRPGQIYSGGSCQVFSDLVGIRGKDVMYVGDHIFGDVLRSKKGRGWRTFLIVPELVHELRVWIDRRDLFAQLETFNMELAEFFINMDIKSSEKSVETVNNLRKQMQDVAHRMDQSYGMTGSLFRCGSRQTFFASQVERYADLYAGSCCNLIYYPLFYFFRAEPMLMPHESTVDQEHAGQLEVDGSQAFLPRNRNLSSADTSFETITPPTITPIPPLDTPPATTPAKQPSEKGSKKSVNFGAGSKAGAPRAATSISSVADANRAIVGRARTPRQSTFVYEEQSDEDESSKEGKSSSGDEDSKNEAMQEKIRKNLAGEKRERFDSENEREMTTHVNEYEDVVVPQTSVVEELPKQN